MAYVIKQLAAPAYLAASSTNIFTTPPSGSFYVIHWIHVNNDDSSAHTFTLYFGTVSGGSTAGTEIAYQVSVGANSTYDMPCYLVCPYNYYLSGLASAGSVLTISVGAESGASRSEERRV